MTIETIITLIVLGATALGGVIALIIAIARGEVKKFIVEQMQIAEEKFKDLPKPQKSIEKLQFVIKAVKEKYKIASLILNIKKFVEYIINIKNIGNK